MPRKKIVPPVVAPPRVAAEYVDLDVLVPWAGNPKDHDIGAIVASIQRYGFRDPVGVNRRNNEIEEGHGRVLALSAMRQHRMPAPSYVLVTNEKWMIPVLFFDDDEVMQHGWSIAHNKTQERGGGYDDLKLFEALRQQASHGVLLPTGFDSDDLETLRRKLEEADGGGRREATLGASTSFRVLITCTDEAQQVELIERFTTEGLAVRALMS